MISDVLVYWNISTSKTVYETLFNNTLGEKTKDFLSIFEKNFWQFCGLITRCK